MARLNSFRFPQFWRRNSRQSLRTRLTLFSVGFLAIALSGFSTYLYESFANEQENTFNTALFNYATDLSQGIKIDFFGSLRVDPTVDLESGKMFPFLAGEAFLQIVDRHGNVLVHSKRLGQENLPFNRPDLLTFPSRRASFETWNLQGEALPANVRKGRYRMIYYPVLRAGPSFVVLQVAVPMLLLDQQKAKLRGFLWIGIPTTLLIFALLGFSISERALRPLKIIIRRASLMNAAQISERLPVPQVDDELRTLTLTLNGLFARLESAFESQDRFVSDASHQLRTPLAILRGELDVLKSKSRSAEELSTFFESAGQELAHLSRLVDELLILARVDAGRDSLQFADLRLDDLVVEAVERLEPLAKKSSIQLRLNLFGSSADGQGSGEATNNFATRGDSDLLKTLLQNLIENAIRYSSPESYVETQLRSTASHFEIEVKNFGESIAPDNMPLLFERFARLPQSEAANPQGVGLGLSIVKRVAEAHAGSVAVESTVLHGTTFTVRLPRS